MELHAWDLDPERTYIRFLNEFRINFFQEFEDRLRELSIFPELKKEKD